MGIILFPAPEGDGEENEGVSAMRKLPVLWYIEKNLPGDLSGGEIPVSIPNTEVKPSSADGTPLLNALAYCGAFCSGEE